MKARAHPAKSAPLLLPLMGTAEEQGGRPARQAFAVQAAAHPAKYKRFFKAFIFAFVCANLFWGGARLQSAFQLGTASGAALKTGGSPAADLLSEIAAGNQTLDRGQYRRVANAILRPPVVSRYSRDGCAHALALPKVALLFLTTGDLFHEATWRQWFQSAEGLVPVAEARETACAADERFWPAVQSYCGIKALDPISKQHLYSVYIHAPPSFPGYYDALWSGRLIPERTASGWGEVTLVEAVRYLLYEAFKDPLNERFVLLSESDIPLYDPLTFYQQLMAEPKSRVNACPGSHTSSWRWNPEMESRELNASLWRKSSQFFTLTREHTRVVVNDTSIFRSFEAHCNGGWNHTLNKYVDCYSDEHYLPTLLAVKGLESEASCESWGPTAVDWSRGGASPRSYRPEEVGPDLIELARGSADGACNATAAHAAAQRLYVHKSLLLSEPKRRDACSALQGLDSVYDAPLDPVCKVLARKFPNTTAAAVAQLFANSSSLGLGLLPIAA